MNQRICSTSPSLMVAFTLALGVVLFPVHLGAAILWRGVMLPPDAVTEIELQKLSENSVGTVVLQVVEGDFSSIKTAAARVTAAGLELNYWFEIGRDPALATAHPEWMASIQGHQEWRRFFPDAARDQDDEVIKAFPWVPVGYAESFNAHSNRVARALAGLPKPAGIWLNDLQGPPAVCGCGHPLCRWTTDYGPKRTATSLGDDAAAEFVRAVGKMSPGARVIPVWATECEEHDKEQLCGGVGCYAGRCWKDWTRKLEPLAKAAPTIGVLALFKALDRDLPVYGSSAGWVGEAVKSFQTMPVNNDAVGIPAKRLLAVVQGWDVTPAELTAQIDHATKAGAGGVLIARTAIEQSWNPELVKLTGKP